jgi:hypothetical protein
MVELADIMKSLVYTDRVRVHTIAGKQGYMSHHTESKEWRYFVTKTKTPHSK